MLFGSPKDITNGIKDQDRYCIVYYPLTEKYSVQFRVFPPLYNSQCCDCVSCAKHTCQDQTFHVCQLLARWESPKLPVTISKYEET